MIESIKYDIYPTYCEQADVLRRMLDAGVGVGVSKHAGGEELYSAIVEVRDNEEYRRNVDRLRRVFRDKRYSCVRSARIFRSMTLRQLRILAVF